MSLNYMKKKIQGIDKLKNSGWTESGKIVVLKISQRLPFKYKAPKQVLENTPNTLSVDELREQWDIVRNDLQIFLNNIEEKNCRKMIYKHPVAGYLDATQALMFFREHIHHHMPQIRKQMK
jgi:hypothetical protein